MNLRKQKGFTLIELLVVIAILGILTAITIIVIDPIAMQNRSRDGVLKAHVEKIGTAAAGLQSTSETSAFPDCPTLLDSLQGATADTCVAASDPGTFKMTVGNVGSTTFTYGYSNVAGSIKSCISTPSKLVTTKFVKWCSFTGIVVSDAAAACSNAGC